MALVSPKNYSHSVASSPYSSPNIGALLKIKVITWSQETGLPVSIRVRVGDKTFNLHRFPLTSKSGYFKKRLNDNETFEVSLPEDFPGGADTFEMIALFIYGSSTLIDPFNVASLRCASQFLEMTEQHSSGNLCDRFDLYLNQVVLQSWDDTLIVLQRCQILLPWSEDLLIVSRCIESLAFMACMEILDPERRRDHTLDTPLFTLEELVANSNNNSQAWNCEIIKDLWIKDLIALPFDFFKRVIRSLRRQGMKEKYVSPIIAFYANKWLLSSTNNNNNNNNTHFCSDILQGVIDLLLPIGDNNNNNKGSSSKVVIPVGFYFALLSRCVELGLKGERNKVKLEEQITALLHFAQVEDFLLLFLQECDTDYSVSIVESMVLKYVASSSNSQTEHHSLRCYRVAELWDSYVVHVVAANPEMKAKRFMELIERVPSSYRQNHDQLYKAISNFLKTHPDISQEEKGLICKNLSCQKLSQEACIEAVQNELMPLRLIVQALFVQQLNTHQAFKECSDSFRYASNCVEFSSISGSLSSSRGPYSRSQNLGESPYTSTDGPGLGLGPEMMGGSGSGPLGFLLQKDIMLHKLKFPTTSEYESTSFRIQSLEQELMNLKRSLQIEKIVTKKEPNLMKKTSGLLLESRSMSKKRNNSNNNNNNNSMGQATSCISSVNFTSHRKYASRLLKVFRRITWFGSRKTKKKQGSTPITTTTQLSKSM